VLLVEFTIMLATTHEKTAATLTGQRPLLIRPFTRAKNFVVGQSAFLGHGS
jgi:hypothetical protein